MSTTLQRWAKRDSTPDNTMNKNSHLKLSQQQWEVIVCLKTWLKQMHLCVSSASHSTNTWAGRLYTCFSMCKRGV